MTAHFIHLPHRKDRMLQLEGELDSQSINDYRIWNGIIDEEISCRGIARAHKQIVQFAKNQSLASVLIGEDDLHFTAAGAFEYYIKNIPSDFDLYLGGITWGTIKTDNTVEDFSGTMFYIVHERFYDTFLSTNEERDLDRALANAGKFVVCQPMVVIQHSGYSDHHKKYLHLELYFRKAHLFAGT